MKKRTVWPATGATGSIRSRMVTPLASVCHLPAGAMFGTVSQFGSVSGTVVLVVANFVVVVLVVIGDLVDIGAGRAAGVVLGGF